MAKDFSEVKKPEKILEAIYDLQDLNVPLRGVSYTKQAPLQIILAGEQKNNLIIITVNIYNPNSFEWFLKKKDDRFIEFFDINRNFLGAYPQSSNSTGEQVSPAPPSDRNYWLLDSQQTMKTKVEIPAKDFYDIRKGEAIYLQFIIDSDLPPTLKYMQNQVDPENYYTVLATSNSIRIRCSSYNRANQQYLCEIIAIDT